MDKEEIRCYSETLEVIRNSEGNVVQYKAGVHTGDHYKTVSVSSASSLRDRCREAQ